MMANVFAVCLVVSVLVLIFMAAKNYSNIDTCFGGIVLVIPIIILGYTLKASATTVEEAKLAFYFIYLDSTVLLAFVFLSMLKRLGIQTKTWMQIAIYSVTLFHLGSVWLGMRNGSYYTDFQIDITPMGTVTKMVGGPLKITHYLYLVAFFLLAIGVLIYAYVKRKDCSKRSLFIYTGIMLTALLMYMWEMLLDVDFSTLPIFYVIGDIIVVVEYDKTHSHEIDCVLVDQKAEDTRRGYVAFDLKKRLLAYNDNALEYVSELAGKRIDAPFAEGDERLIEVFYPLMDRYEKEHKASEVFSHENMFFKCNVTYFHMNKEGRALGYLFEIDDVTAEQGYMNLIREYGDSLQKDVNEKTEHIREIQQKVVLGMATIIENRDMNTGGHVKRTSDVVQILVDEMRRQNLGDLDDKYANNIVRSAPMHDLGKISIDNAILNKPGKLTDEEFKIMKTHAAKSGEIVKAIMSGVEEPEFVQTAQCLARFHHERWDGKGYPERLEAYEIPLEARIMAVADVYDALVSKRCYKEPMSFDVAANIMLEGMGTQFDPMMKSVFEGCRSQLEEYYVIHREE